MEPPDARPPERSVESFLGEATRDLSDWHWLWAGDHPFPVRSQRGLLGGLLVGLRKLLRPLVKAPQADLWDRQRTFNLVLIEKLVSLQEARAEAAERLAGLETGLSHLRLQTLEHVESIADTVERLEGYRVEGLDDLLKHNDALFALLDQKLDRYRRETRELWGRLGAALAKAETGGTAELSRVRDEQGYVELERRFRGTEEDIEERLSRYVGYLEGRGEVLDLGCGRGEALAALGRHGIPARGVDANAQMLDLCREKGLEVEERDLFEALQAVEEGSLGGVVSFHVVEHLPLASLDRLVRLAWRALARGGVLILETPNPLSLVAGARNFWVDPTHRRPIHPESLMLLYRLAGFEPVERIDLRPFAAEDRLPQVSAGDAPSELRHLAEQTNALRDRLDELLFGFQDYAVVGFK